MARGLGKGIGAFFPEAQPGEEDSVQQLAMTALRPNPYQPRKHFDKQALHELAESIKTHGVLQPIIVRKSIKGYDIVAGERRFRASQEAGVSDIPAIVREMTDQQMMELALLENLQREDLSPIEEASAYQKLMEELSLTQEQLAARLGKSRPHIANHLRLLTLPTYARELIEQKKLSMGHGRALLGLKNKRKLKPLITKVEKDQINVRQLEQLIQKMNQQGQRDAKKPAPQTAYIKEREGYLRERFGTAVHISQNQKKGKIEIEFYSNEDLQRILEMLHEES
ncbi:ParB/RepB/Spo0J family partition protein [Aureibacillus halotolerans]|uniref:Chromosome segregation DNA-binding protein n=1 Tax=Aureibacillus halotolerans TaxID=1508390 RepID=A0A4R6TWV0_9BACI|nr:ParB/RepB/Spo0J family partition protein [Aureibacillus halotolerans]TDQ38350.1 chromosome segregation DNA-binding protein [Aureibacillus halotolerans]